MKEEKLKPGRIPYKDRGKVKLRIDLNIEGCIIEKFGGKKAVQKKLYAYLDSEYIDVCGPHGS